MIAFGRRCLICGTGYPTEQIPVAFPPGAQNLTAVCVKCRPAFALQEAADAEKRRAYQKAYQKSYRKAYTKTAAHAVSQHRYWAKKAGRDPSI